MDILARGLKYIIFIFNIFCLVCGIVLLVLGALMLDNFSHLKYFQNFLRTQPLPIVIIVIGSFICIASIFGCCGAIQEKKICLWIYALLMFVLFLMQIALIIWTFINVQTFSYAIDKVVDDAWNNKNPTPMNTLQLYLNCCGVKSYEDYAKEPFVPPTCCGSINKICEAKDYQKRVGCRSALHKYWDNERAAIRYSGVIVALTELLCIMCACYLRSSIGKR